MKAEQKPESAIVFFIEEPVFKTSTMFIFNCGPDRFKRIACRKMELKESEFERPPNGISGTVHTLWNKDDSLRGRVVWVEKIDPKSPQDVAGLGHEIFHLVVRICRAKGIPIIANLEDGSVGDEPPAYLTEFYMNRCLTEIGRRSRKITARRKRAW